MKHRLLHLLSRAFLVILLWLPTRVSAQATAKSLFLAIPDSLCPLLTANNRADCIDFLESRMTAQVENRLGQSSRMTHLTSDYIRIELSAQHTWQMKLLHAPDSTRLICVVNTVCAPACDSSLHFYTDNWQAVDADSRFAPPTLNDFLVAAGDTVASPYGHSEARRELSPLLVSLTLHPDTSQLTATLTTPDFLDAETAKRLKPFLRTSLLYNWTNGQWRRE